MFSSFEGVETLLKISLVKIYFVRDMKIRLCLCFFALWAINLSCDKENNPSAEILPPIEGGDQIPANCNVELVSAIRITADMVTDRDAIGDYYFTLKSVKTVKEKISVEGRFVQSGVAVEIVTVSVTSVGIDETIEIKVSPSNIFTEEDLFCLEYVVKVEAAGSRDCDALYTDC